MSKSILQPDGEEACYISGSHYNLDCHHIMGGTANRKIADKWGVWVWLRHDIHMDLHDRNTELKLQLKKEAQEAFEKLYGRDKWMSLFRKNYLEDDENECSEEL